MIPFRGARTSVLCLLVVLAGACVDGSPVAPEAGLSVPLLVAASFGSARDGAEVGTGELTLAVLVGKDAGSGEVYGTRRVPIDPAAEGWELELEVTVPSDRRVDVMVSVELGSETETGDFIEWSGRTTVGSVGAGSPVRAVPRIDLYRGPLANLDARLLEILPGPGVVIEGDEARLEAAIDGEGTRAFFRSLDPTTAEVDPEGRLRALVRGQARIVAEGGRLADTVRVEVAPIPLPPDGEVRALDGAMDDSGTRLVGALGDEEGAAAIADGLEGLRAALAEGIGSVIRDAVEGLRAALRDYAAADPALRRLDGPELSLIEVSVDALERALDRSRADAFAERTP